MLKILCYDYYVWILVRNLIGLYAEYGTLCFYDLEGCMVPYERIAGIKMLIGCTTFDRYSWELCRLNALNMLKGF
jgi:hypothetical protein